MSTFIRSLPLLILMQMGTALYAQEAQTPTEDPQADGQVAAEDAAPDAAPDTNEPVTEQAGDSQGGLDLGRPVDNDPSYIKEQYGDWQLQCFRTETDEDPCQMYQLLREDAGNPVAEFSVFRLPDDSQAVAGATIVVPLGTLLGEGLKISVDSGPLKAYNFAFCSMGGCFARIGFTEQDIDAFKAGGTARLFIVPAQAPDQVVEINASLDGFTAAFNEVSILQN